MQKQEEINITPELRKYYNYAQLNGIAFILQLTETGDYGWGDTDIDIFEYVSCEKEINQKLQTFGVAIPETTYTKYYTFVIDARDTNASLDQNVYYFAKEWLNKRDLNGFILK